MGLFSSAFRYALVLAISPVLLHFGGASARAETCGGDEADGFFLSASFSGSTPIAVGTIPDKKIAAGASFVRFSARFYFKETTGSALAYSAASSHPGIASVGDICGSMIEIRAVKAGTAKITITATANGGSATQEATVIVDPKAVFPSSPSNSPPVAQGSIPDRTFTRATSPDRFSVSSYFSDPDGDALTYSASAFRTGVASASVTGAMLSLGAVSRDSTRITVTAKDQGGLVATQSFLATVANSPPAAQGSIADRTFTRATSPDSFSLSSYFSDPDPEDRLTYTASPSSAGVVNTSVTGNTLTLTAAAKGKRRVTVTATDPGGLIATQPFDVTIANSPPVAKGAMPARSFTLGSSETLGFGVSSYFEDADGETLTYQPSSSPGGVVSASIPANGSTLTLTALKAGSSTVTVTAEDASDRALQRFTVTVHAKTNQRPTVKKNIIDQNFTVGDGADSFNLSEYFSDPDPEDVPKLAYKSESSNSGVATVNPTGSPLRITPKGAGKATVKVTATDPGGLSVSQDVVVTVKKPPPPPLTVEIKGPSSIESGTSHTWRSKVEGGTPPYRYSWQVSTRCTILDHLSAADDEPCTRQWSSAGSDSSLTQTITTTEAYAHVRLSVSDAGSPAMTAEDTHSIEVYQPNNAPVANGTVPSRTLTLGSSATRLNVSSWFTDKDNDPLRYTVSSSPAGIVSASIPSNGGTLTLSALKAGRTTVTVTASDGKASATQSFEVRVNRRPVASKTIPAQNLTAGGSSVAFNLTEYFSDPDGDNLKWTITRSNSHVTTSLSGNTLTIAPVTAGTSSVGIHASDSYASVSQMVTVNVATAAGLSASISGPTRVLGEGSSTWQASVSGGRSPYAYRWRYRRACSSGPSENAEADSAREVCTEWASGGSKSSFSLLLEHGTTIELRVTDANNDSVTTTLGVSYAGL